jgi:hypothetical protein
MAANAQKSGDEVRTIFAKTPQYFSAMYLRTGAVAAYAVCGAELNTRRGACLSQDL